MDVVTENVENVTAENPTDEVTAPVTETWQKPFPDNEYGKDGKLKKLRGRMIKTLLKYEFRAIAPIMGVMLGLLALTTVMVWFTPKDDLSAMELYGFLPFLLYTYSAMGLMLVAVLVPVTRFEKTLFKNEGYLTLSVPATMEEHVFAKHLLAICGFLVSIVAVVLSIIVVGFASGQDIFIDVSGVELVFGLIETFILMLLGCVAIFTVSNAFNCFGQRFSKRAPLVFIGVGIYILLSVIFNVINWMSLQGWLSFFDTPAGQHVGACMLIVILAGINVLCVWYQLRYLNKKLDLK